jgi:hypothetical protein
MAVDMWRSSPRSWYHRFRDKRRQVTNWASNSQRRWALCGGRDKVPAAVSINQPRMTLEVLQALSPALSLDIERGSF